MADHEEPKRSRLQRWRERRRAKAERARGIHSRTKQARDDTVDRDTRAGGSGLGGPGTSFGS